VAPGPLLELLAPENIFAATEAWPPDPAGRRAALAAAREFHADTALVLPPSFSSAWFAWRSGARVRIGFAHEGRAPLLTRWPRRAPRGDRHLSEEYLLLAGIAEAAAALPDLPPAPGAVAEARALRAAHPVLGAGPLAVVGPGASYGPAKQWGMEHFAALGRRLAARGHGVAVCGTAAEASVCGALAAAIGTAAVSLAGRTPLPVLAALCAQAAVAVCNDSGLAHLAAATGTATVAVFGSTSSAWTAPLGRRVRIVQRPPVCAPCFRRTCRIGYVCLRAVTVDAVDAACRELAA
jgi:heptosyltransferase-2